MLTIKRKLLSGAEARKSKKKGRSKRILYMVDLQCHPELSSRAGVIVALDETKKEHEGLVVFAIAWECTGCKSPDPVGIGGLWLE